MWPDSGKHKWQPLQFQQATQTQPVHIDVQSDIIELVQNKLTK